MKKSMNVVVWCLLSEFIVRSVILIVDISKVDLNFEYSDYAYSFELNTFFPETFDTLVGN